MMLRYYVYVATPKWVVKKKHHPKWLREDRIRVKSLAHSIILEYKHHHKNLLFFNKKKKKKKGAFEWFNMCQKQAEFNGPIRRLNMSWKGPRVRRRLHTAAHHRESLFYCFHLWKSSGFLMSGYGRIFWDGIQTGHFFHFPFIKSFFNPDLYFELQGKKMYRSSNFLPLMGISPDTPTLV